MLDEGSGVMEKKPIVRQPAASAQCRNGAHSVERKADFVPNRRGRRQGGFGAGKVSDGQPRPIPIPKWDRPMGDRRQRQRISYDYRQREEVVENSDVFDVITNGSRKGNANHLLNFKIQPRQTQDDRWYNKPYSKNHGGGTSRKAKRYKKEQFLQACCQFVVRDTGDYSEQSINCDTLVDWNMIELVRSFTVEPVQCPICLHYPIAGKITRCGHTYCWACVLHYLKLGQDEARKCPICYETIEAEELRSVQWIDVPSFKIGDDITMKLMRKAKGSVIALPKQQWRDRQGKHMNIEDGPNTKYMKLLLASLEQIKIEVIGKERDELTAQLLDAEESELCFIQMALDQLAAREASLDKVFLATTQAKNTVYIPGLGCVKTFEAENFAVSDINRNANITTYGDAFEDEIVAEDAHCDDSLSMDDCDKLRKDSESLLPFGSPPYPFPMAKDQEVNPVPLSLEETSDHLELPINEYSSQKQSTRTAPVLNTSDTYYFYQAATGQHIYLNSLNAQCLAREYGSLEGSPDVISASIVAIERIFMTEDVRKRLRYLDHIPLTSEIHVVELNIKPPTVSKETLKFFEGAFNKKRRQRQQKERDDRRRAKRFEIEHKKSFGIYPEVRLQLDSVYQFPAAMSGENEPTGDMRNIHDVTNVQDSTAPDEEIVVTNRSRNDSTTSDESVSASRSFAEMLRVRNMPGGAWGRSTQTPQSFPSLSDQKPEITSMKGNDDSDGESLPAPKYCDSMSDAIAKALDGISLQKSIGEASGKPPAGGRKKRKAKQVLFSTAMAREKN